MLVFKSLTDKKLIALISSGAVGVLPTDTIYGLVGRAADLAAVKRLYSLKTRRDKPGTLIAANIEQLIGLGIKARYLKAVEYLWPGPISIEIACSPELDYLNLAARRQAMRLPKEPQLQSLLKQTGPLLTTSANLPNQPPANTVAQAQAYFKDLVDFYVDGGDLSGRAPSTIIRVIDDAIEVVRAGAVKIDESGRITS